MNLELKKDELAAFIGCALPIMSGIREVSMLDAWFFPDESDSLVQKTAQFNSDAYFIDPYFTAKAKSDYLQKRLPCLPFYTSLKVNGVEVKVQPTVCFLTSASALCVVEGTVFMVKAGVKDPFVELDALSRALSDLAASTTEIIPLPGGAQYRYAPRPKVWELAKRIATVEGRLLGYPDCDIRAYIENKDSLVRTGKVRSPEQITASKLLANDAAYGFLLKLFQNPSELESIIEKGMPDEFYAFPYVSLYPCSVNCDKAIQIGKRLEKAASEYGLEAAARLLFLTIPIRHVAIEYDIVPKMDYCVRLLNARKMQNMARTLKKTFDSDKSHVAKVKSLPKDGVAAVASVILDRQRLDSLFFSLARGKEKTVSVMIKA